MGVKTFINSHYLKYELINLNFQNITFAQTKIQISRNRRSLLVHPVLFFNLNTAIKPIVKKKAV
jgi:hypothetical protein